MSFAHVAAAAAEEGEHLKELPIPPVAFGLLAVVAFAALLLVTFAFRSVGTRH